MVEVEERDRSRRGRGLLESEDSGKLSINGVVEKEFGFDHDTISKQARTDQQWREIDEARAVYVIISYR